MKDTRNNTGGIRITTAPRRRSDLNMPLSLLKAAIRQEGIDASPHIVIDGFLIDGWLVRVKDSEFEVTIKDITDREPNGPSPWVETGDDRPCPAIGDSFPRPFLSIADDDAVYQLTANFSLPETLSRE